MRYLHAFLEIEEAFFTRAIKKKPFMGLFIIVMLIYTLFIASVAYGKGTPEWWFIMAAGLLGYLVIMPMIMYLISPKTFFPANNGNKDNKNP